MNTIPEEYRHLPALSIRNPWAGSIIYLGKDVENRPRRSHYIGLFLIHASLTLDMESWARFYAAHFDVDEALKIKAQLQQTGGIVGVAEMWGCVTTSQSKWFVGPYGYLVRNAKPLPFVPCKGALGFFKPKLPLAA